jgi:aspartyl protease family protein
MTYTNPWSRDPNPPPPHPARVWIWFGFLLACTVGIWALFHLFPEVSLSDMDTGWLLRLVAVLAFASSAILFGRRTTFGDAARNIAIWIAIAGVLMLGYSFRGELETARDRIAQELMPSEPVVDGSGTVVLSENEDSAYYVTAEVNGTRVRFAIDTGSSDIVLSPADARRVGIDPSALNYDRYTSTPNGTGHAATVTLDSLALGPIQLSEQSASVNQAAMDTSLLGMTFLHQMKSFEFRDHHLYLHWR